MFSTEIKDIVCMNKGGGTTIAPENFVEDANWIDNKTRGFPN